MKKRCVALLLCMAMTITMAACGQSTDKKTDAQETADVQKNAEKQEEDDAVMELESIIIHGYEWGPAVIKYRRLRYYNGWYEPDDYGCICQ